MVNITRGSTPILPIYMDGVDLTDATVYFTINQNDRKWTKVYPSLDGSVVAEYDGTKTTFTLYLSQHDSLYLREGKAELQPRIIYEDGTCPPVGVKQINIKKVLLEGVITYVSR